MKAVIKHTKRNASILHGAQTSYVSLVDRGANETPFKQVKSTKGLKDMAIKKRSAPGAAVTEAKAHKVVATGKKADFVQKTETVMAKMLFDGEHFPDQSDVLDYLAEAEWDSADVEIVQNADGDWIARAKGTTDESFEMVSKVATDEEGVQAFVGKRVVSDAAPEDDTEEAADAEEEDAPATETKDDMTDANLNQDGGAAAAGEGTVSGKKKPTATSEGIETPRSSQGASAAAPSKKSEFLAKRKQEKGVQTKLRKFSQWAAAYTDDNTLAGAIEDGMEYDATPPGFGDVQAAFSGAITSILGDDFTGDVRTALSKAAADFAQIVGDLNQMFEDFIGMGTEELSKEYSADEIEKLNKWAESNADYITEQASVAKPTKKKAAAVVTASAQPDPAAFADLITKALDPLAKRVEAVAGTVEAMASRRPTKKAIASEGDSEAVLETMKKAAPVDPDSRSWMKNKQTKNLF
jgi:hypothetical protein